MTRPARSRLQKERDQWASILRDMRAMRRELKAIAASNEAAWASIDESLIEIDRRVHPEVGKALERIFKGSPRP